MYPRVKAGERCAGDKAEEIFTMSIHWHWTWQCCSSTSLNYLVTKRGSERENFGSHHPREEGKEKGEGRICHIQKCVIIRVGTIVNVSNSYLLFYLKWYSLLPDPWRNNLQSSFCESDSNLLSDQTVKSFKPMLWLHFASQLRPI